MSIRAGKLRHKITIQQPGASRDSCGGPAKSNWTDFKTGVWASVEPLQGKEYHAAVQDRAEVSTRFRIRFIAGLKPDMRIVYDGRVFGIVSIIDPNERHVELQIMTTEVQR